MGRSPCCDESNLKKGPWTPEEDQKLIDYIQKHGHGSWRSLPKHAGLRRCGKSCRLRWTNYLRPDIKRGKFSQEEENTILHLHSILGNKWSAIATNLPGRTDNEIKNYWNTHLKKRLVQMGIDPMTHQPRTDLFSCLPQLIALVNLKELLEHNQLANNLRCLNLLLQPSSSTNISDTDLAAALNLTNPIPPLQQETPSYNDLNILPPELGLEREEMAHFFPVENSPASSQPLPQEVPVMNFQTTDEQEVVGQTGLASVKSSVPSSPGSSLWTLPPLVEHQNNHDNSRESSTTVGYGGSGGSGGEGSSYTWPDFLFQDSFLDENLGEMI